jgi:excisionase family DNA binding protein
MSQHVQTPRWLPKAEAASFLGVSERQIERHMAAGRFQVKRLPRESHQTAPPVMLRTADVQAVRDGKPNYYPVVRVGPDPGLLPPAGVATLERPSPLPLPAFGALAPLVEALLMEQAKRKAPKQPLPWLSITEGARLLGLPRRFVKQLVDDGKVASVDVGITKPRRLVSRDSLLAWRP